MSVNRVQKLLFSEYCDFEDMVLIESPFAQTTKDGRGIRQVHIGLTPTKLVLATDVLPPVDSNKVTYIPGVDPDIETFELIAIYPVECVNLSVYRRRKRQALKARFCNNRVLYFELGGFEKRKMFWNLWCEKVRFLSPEGDSSHSETSVATSTTGSTLYLLDKRWVINNGIKQLWYRFGPNTASRSHLTDNINGNRSTDFAKKWTDRHLYLGKNFNDFPLNYKPVMFKPSNEEFLNIEGTKMKRKDLPVRRSHINLIKEKNLNFGDTVQINRFGSGIYEGCNSGLYLTVDDYIISQRASQIFLQEKLQTIEELPSLHSCIDYEELAETAVVLWEINSRQLRLRHRRRYGIMPQPHFLNGLGPWTTIPGSQYSVQVKRAVSVVAIKRQPVEPELRLPISKRQLVASISCELLNSEKNCTTNSITCVPKNPVIFFWTPDYWYRPRSAKDAYFQLQTHLTKLKNYHKAQISKGRKKKTSLFKRFQSKYMSKDSDEEVEESVRKKPRKCKGKFTYSNLFGNRVDELSDIIRSKEKRKKPDETSLQYLKRILRLDVSVTAWDFDSTTLAEQLTLIDKELFLKISSTELEILQLKGNLKYSPNIAAFVAFSHRISCLVTTEIMRDDSEKIRARLMARFISVADKCHKMSNFQSCKSVLSGLQSPAVYRLKQTWAYLRKRHASKYQLYEYLCRLHKDSRTPTYQKAFFVVSQNKPFLPYIGDIFVKLLDKLPEYKIQRKLIRSNTSLSTNQESKCKTLSPRSEPVQHLNLFTKLLKVFTASVTEEERNNEGNVVRVKEHKVKNHGMKRKTKYKGLCDYYKPLDCYEDNRLQCLFDATVFLEKCQLGATSYNNVVNELARSYLLKARYKEGRENFYNSFRVENA